MAGILNNIGNKIFFPAKVEYFGRHLFDTAQNGGELDEWTSVQTGDNGNDEVQPLTGSSQFPP